MTVGPGAHAGATAGLVGVPATGVEFAISVARDVDVFIGELGAAVVEAGGVGEDLLEGWGHDFVGDGFAVYGVAAVRVGDFEEAVGVWVEIVAAGVCYQGVGDSVAGAVRVEIGVDRHGMGFGEDELVAIGMAADVGVDAETEDVLVVGGKDTRVHDGTPGDAVGGWAAEVVVNGLGGEDASGAGFVAEFADLVEDVGEDVFVVGDCDDGLEDEFAVASDCCAAGSIVGMFPTNAAVLFVDADAVFKRNGVAFVVGDCGADVLDVAETIAA